MVYCRLMWKLKNAVVSYHRCTSCGVILIINQVKRAFKSGNFLEIEAVMLLFFMIALTLTCM